MSPSFISEVTMARSKRVSNVVPMPTTVSANEPVSGPPFFPDANAVARRAYGIYESRERIDGYDVEDWLQAERELKSMAVWAS
jgi:Protein of unknown function (DUF2934)